MLIVQENKQAVKKGDRNIGRGEKKSDICVYVCVPVRVQRLRQSVKY